jgi:uncharacterized protein YecE (DUF72 family)
LKAGTLKGLSFAIAYVDQTSSHLTSDIHIGTSGWSYKHWKGLIYPPNVKAADWLSYYARHFDTAEINRSFYSLPKPEVIAHWAATVPAHFIFCPKMSRYLTHMKKLRDPEEPLQRFFNVFEPLPLARTGPVLVQLPAMLGFREATAHPFFEALVQHWPQYHFVIEVRHAGWLSDESFALMRRYGVGFVISQSGAHFPYSEEITSEQVYLRFHGPEALYASPYSGEHLQYYAQKMRAWAECGHKVWAFFNNDIGGHAWLDALRLRAMLP